MFCAYDFRIEDNIAQEGTAIYADDAQAGGVISGIGGSVFLNARAANGLCATPDSPALLGAFRCAADVPCNRIALNTALDPGGNPTGGSTILLQTAATFVADRIDGRLTTPCGGCRQRLAEFSGPTTPVHVIDPGGEGRTWRMDELLPAAFAMDEPE